MKNAKLKMQNFGIWILVIGVCLGFGIWLLGFVTGGCGKLTPFFPSATTNLKSSTFAALSAQGVTALGTYEGGFWKLTPTKITGKVASVFFPVDDKEDEGVVVYGNYRPDLLRANADLYDFDLSKTTVLSGIISKKPGYKGGISSIILMMYGYFDVHFTRAGTEEVIRFAYGSSDPYQKGDVLLKNKSTGNFEWLNLSNSSFEVTRPATPEVVSFIRDFYEPKHPETTYYFPLAARITPGGIDLPASLIDNNNLTFTVDFAYAKALLFDPNAIGKSIKNQDEFDALTPAELIKAADLTQNRLNWWSVSATTEGIVNCTVSIEATPIKGGT